MIEARLSDAEFFWNKDKSQNLVKKVSELKSMNFFKGLGNYFDKVQKYIYDLYLKSNNQEAGIMTYNKVSNFIIDYYQREELSDFFN